METAPILLVLLFLCSCINIQAQISYCSGKSNTNPIQTAPPKFLAQVNNGKLYSIGQGDDTILLLHVWGSAYQMGFANGQLLKSQITELVPGMIAHFESQVADSIDQYIGKDLASFVADFGLRAALDLEYEMTRWYAPEYFFDEMKGIADASGVDYNSLVQVHMLPELVKAACSIFGAGKTATPDGSLYQLRALDWDVSGPMQKYPVVTIYHPDQGQPFANVGWAGWIGSITGMSSAHMAMSEKVTDHEFGSTTRFGIPFNFLMRDVLQFDANLDAAITRLSNAKRTCAIWLGCGDGKPDINRVNLFQYSASDLVVIDYNTVIPYPSNASKYEHPLIRDVVYWGVNQQCYSALLQQQRGNITPQTTISNIISLSRTGNLHAAIFDLTKMFMYVANARADGESGPPNAYERSFVQFNMTALFSEPRF